jgi:hypothetical protein
MRITDGDWALVDHDFHMKRSTWARGNPDGTTTYRTDYHIDDTLEANKVMQNGCDSGWKGDWHKVASIPVGIFHDKLAEAFQQDDMKHVSKFLNDVDNRAFRAKLGRV